MKILIHAKVWFAILMNENFEMKRKALRLRIQDTIFFYKHSQSREHSRVDEVYANIKSSSTRSNDIL
jgi:hypothetical protein